RDRQRRLRGHILLQRNGQQPQLNEQNQQHHHHQGYHALPALFQTGLFRVYPSHDPTTPSAKMAPLSILRRMRGRGRGGGPSSTFPVFASNAPLWQGHSSRLRLAAK